MCGGLVCLHSSNTPAEPISPSISWAATEEVDPKKLAIIKTNEGKKNKEKGRQNGVYYSANTKWNEMKSGCCCCCRSQLRGNRAVSKRWAEVCVTWTKHKNKNIFQSYLSALKRAAAHLHHHPCQHTHTHICLSRPTWVGQPRVSADK